MDFKRLCHFFKASASPDSGLDSMDFKSNYLLGVQKRGTIV